MTGVRNDDVDLIAYVFGDVPSTTKLRIDALAKRDPEVSAKIALLRLGTGRDVRQRRSYTRLASSVAAVLLVAVGVGAGWVILNPRPLLQDDFSDEWFDSSRWLPPPEFVHDSGIKEQNGFVKLVNRGYLITRREFFQPLMVSFDSNWSELGTNPLYADHLAVVLRTSGTAMPEPPHEISDGVIVKLNAWSGTAEIWSQPDAPHTASTPKAIVKLPAERWHHVRITDDGDWIAVYVMGPAMPDSSCDTPILAARCPTRTGHGHIVLYNRECVAHIPHESCIDNLVVTAN